MDHRRARGLPNNALKLTLASSRSLARTFGLRHQARVEINAGSL